MSNLTTYEYDIFLSHNHADEDWTARLAERLEKEDWLGRKLRVFFSPWDIRPGQSIPLEIEKALPKSRKVGLIMSPEAIASAWVELERLVTNYIAVSARQERLIPLLRRDCDIPALVQHILYIDFRDDAQFEESYRRLLAVIKDEPLQRTSHAPSSNPISPLPFIPRTLIVDFVERQDREGRDILQQLKDELAPHKRQLVVLSGAGGVGKTTLAIEAAHGLMDVFARRILWVDAEKHTNFGFPTLLDEIARQLGQPELMKLAAAQKEEALQPLISSAPMLIVLDNFETITPEEQETQSAEYLAHRLPCSSLIITRQKISVARNIPVLGMLQTEAHKFLKRLIEQTADPSIFTESVCERIIETVEGVPLLIQWVVAQINLAQAPEEVLDELAHGVGEAAERVFDRSFNLPQMAEGGRAVLLALSLFRPSATRPMLGEVAGLGKDKDKKKFKKAQQTLASLWLVKQTDGGQRLTVEGLTRALTEAHLSRDPRSKTFRQRLVERFLRFAKANAKPTAAELNALESEKDNVLAALNVAFDSKDWESVMKIVLAFGQFLYIHGYWEEAIRSGEQALKAAHDSAVKANIAVFAHNMAIIFQMRGELEEARQLYNDSLEIERKIGNRSGIATTLHELGRLAQDQGEIEEARRLYNESLEIHKKLGDQSGIAIGLHQLGMISLDEEDLAGAENLFNQSLIILRKLGDKKNISQCLESIGKLRVAQGRFTEARSLFDKSLEMAQALGAKSLIGSVKRSLGLVAEKQGKKTEAGRLFREALSIFEELGSPEAEKTRGDLERVESEAFSSGVVGIDAIEN